MSDILSLALLFSTIRLTTPLVWAAIGGLYSERSGVINVALEGLMLAGAFTAAAVTFYTRNPWLGLVAAMLAGGMVASVLALVCIRFHANEVVAGTAINILFLGLPAVLSGALFPSAGSTPQSARGDLVPDLGQVSTLSMLAVAVVAATWYVLYRTPFGLRLRAVGENPEAADAAGVRVQRIRYAAVIISGALAGIGGAYLSIRQSSLCTGNTTGGRGSMALAPPP